MSGKIILPSAISAARPVGSMVPPATGPPPAAKTSVKGKKLTALPTALPSAIVKEEKTRGRPSKDERRIERRMEINSNIADLLDNKPTKQKVRVYLLARIQELLVERGIATM